MTSENAAPAEMPGVEEIARVLFQRSVYHGYDAETLKREWTRTEGIHRGNARAILALFAPILAEKERFEMLYEGQKGAALEHLRHRQAAEAELAAERERCAKIAEDVCATPPADFAGMELEAFHRGADAMNEAIAAAIRAEGE